MSQPIRKVQFLPSQQPDIPDCFLSFVDSSAPTFVGIHGISRNAAEIATRFANHPAFRSINIVAPLFEKNRFGKYQLLQSRSSRKTASDTAVFRLLEELDATHAMDIQKLLVFGFSGGAQMAHRLAMLHPARISRLCAVSAGWYLLPDVSLPYPYGVGEGCPVKFDGQNFLDIPVTVIVGKRDTRIDASVRQDPEIIARQGKNRVERGKAWVENIAAQAAEYGKANKARLLLLENGSHDFGLCARDTDLMDQVARALL